MWTDRGVVVWAHYLGGRQGYPRRLNGVKLTINDAGVYLDGPHRIRFLVSWSEVDEIAVEPTNPDDKGEATYVTRLVKKGRGSSLPVSKPAAAYFRIETTAGESVVYAIAGISPDQFREETAAWVDWPDLDHEPANSTTP